MQGTGKTGTALAVTALLLTLAAAGAARAAGSSLSASDQQFLSKAAQGGMAEVELGRLAARRAKSASVKQFAEHMVHDHSQANAELKSLAARKHVTLPKSVSAEDRQTMARLQKLSGADFDKAYLSDMVEDHTKDVSEFKKESRSANDSAVKAWAVKTLPTLQHHLHMAQSAADKIGASAARH